MSAEEPGAQPNNTSAQPVKGKKPRNPVSVHFLGTCSGGGPIVSRQCSSLAVEFHNDIWLFDAADGTNNRLHQSSLRMANISRIFITHMHADHVLGIVAILGVIMSGVGQTEAGLERLRQLGVNKKAGINLYGPVGLRHLIRNILQYTCITLTGVYAVHELVPPGGTPSSNCGGEQLHVNEGVGQDFIANEDGVWEGIVDEASAKGARGWRVDAGPLVHRVPAVGYVLTEPAPRHALDVSKLIPILQENAEALSKLDPPVKHPLSLLSTIQKLPPPSPITLPSGYVLYPPEPTGEPGRKLVIFGDCSGGTPNTRFQELCQDASFLVHECTNGAIPESIAKGEKGQRVRVSGLEQSLEVKRDKEFEQAARDRAVPREPWVHFSQKHKGTVKSVEAVEEFAARRDKIAAKAQSRGHSTPQQVGEFARAIGARRVALNHFSAMFPSPSYCSNEPFPSLLGPVSPFPYPTANVAVLASKLPKQPLECKELHLRLILQALANQVSAEWNGSVCHDHGVKEQGEPHCIYLAVPSRDFMVYRIPSHEITEEEHKILHRRRAELTEVTRSWADYGGVWVWEGDKARWIGVEEPHGAAPAHPPRSPEH